MPEKVWEVSDMLKECLENVRKTVPLVHNITNYVTVNDVANVLLACGGSPIMSDEAEDVRKKIMSMFTDPNHLRVEDPGKVEGPACYLFDSPGRFS